MNGGIINSNTRLHHVGYFYGVILRCTDPWILNCTLKFICLLYFVCVREREREREREWVSLHVKKFSYPFFEYRSVLLVIHNTFWCTHKAVAKSDYHVCHFSPPLLDVEFIWYIPQILCCTRMQKISLWKYNTKYKIVQNKYEICGLHSCIWLSHKKSYCTDQTKTLNGLHTT
jgi:hypothetical protein